MSLLYGIFLFFPFAVILAGFYDIDRYEIPHFIPISLSVIFIIFACLSPHFTWEIIGYHFLTAFCVFIIGFILFITLHFGGGDAKILSAIALWLGFNDFIIFLNYLCFVGGGVAFFLCYFRTFPCYPIILMNRWTSNLYLGTAGTPNAIPYAVPIAISLLLILPKTFLYQMLTL